VNQQNATGYNQKTAAYVAGELDVTNSCKVGNQPNTPIINKRAPVHYFPDQLYPQHYHLTPVRVDLFSVEQTAEWIRTLSLSNGWEEASHYSLSFYQNAISGYQLGKITIESLKYDLGIAKYGHRLEIMAEIERVYPGLQRHVGKVASYKMDKSSSLMTNSAPDPESEVVDTKPLQTLELLSSAKYKAAPRDFSSSINRSSSQTPTAGVITNYDSVALDNKNNQFSNSCGEQHRVITEKDQSSDSRVQKMNEGHAGKVSPAKVLSFSVRRKSLRARPDNPTKYKALRNAKIRSGKSVRSDIVSYLTKGSVVVINQIKGRSGRVVVLLPNGDFNKVGWVTLYTHDRQQLMEKYNYNRQGEKMIRDIM